MGFWGLVAAQFLGAFNDNALRWFIIAFAMKGINDPNKVGTVASLASALFLAPYLIFSTHAGSLADHFPKRKVLMASKAAEAAIMASCFVGLWIGGNFNVTLGFLLISFSLLGIQAAYYSPPKFGALPEILSERILSWGNGIFEMTGVFAIIAGSVLGAAFVGIFEERLYWAPLIFTSAAVLGLIATWFVPATVAADPSGPIRKNPLQALQVHGGKLVGNRILFLCLVAVVYLWSLGLLFQLNMALYGKDVLGLEPSQTGFPMAIVAVGVGIGNIVAGYASGRTIEFGIVPIASLGMGLSAVAFFFAAMVPITSYALVAVLGFFAGLYVVPTHALLQEESADRDKGGVWAATNFVQTLGMLAAAGIFAALEFLKLSPPTIFLVCGIGTLATTVAQALILPESVGRALVWLKGRLWRSRVEGQSHVPPRGPILFLVAGPPRQEGYLLLAGTRRFVRLVLPESRRAGLFSRTLARTLKAIVVPEEPSPADVDRAVCRVRQALESGEAVGAFAAHSPSGADGTSILARRLLEAARELTATVIPAVPPPAGGWSEPVVSFGPACSPTASEDAILGSLLAE